jgi:hypothetical protein
VILAEIAEELVCTTLTDRFSASNVESRASVTNAARQVPLMVAVASIEI